MPIVCLFGTDGTGKSTLAKKLANRLKKGGFNVKLSWMRGSHTLASLLAQFLSKFSSCKGSDNPYYGITIPRKLKRLWQLIEFASALPIIILKFIVPSALGSWVVADRYVPDLITWVSITTNDQDYYSESIESKFLLALSQKAHAKIYVTATLKELSKRRKGADPDHVRMDSCNNQLELYDRIASIIKANRLNTTNKSPNTSLEEALNLLHVPQMPERPTS